MQKKYIYICIYIYVLEKEKRQQNKEKVNGIKCEANGSKLNEKNSLIAHDPMRLLILLKTLCEYLV